jgi:hypothetical protein
MKEGGEGQQEVDTIGEEAMKDLLKVICLSKKVLRCELLSKNLGKEAKKMAVSPPSLSRLSRKCVSSTSQPYGSPRPVSRIALIFFKGIMNVMKLHRKTLTQKMATGLFA